MAFRTVALLTLYAWASRLLTECVCRASTSLTNLIDYGILQLLDYVAGVKPIPPVTAVYPMSKRRMAQVQPPCVSYSHYSGFWATTGSTGLLLYLRNCKYPSTDFCLKLDETLQL